MERKRKLYWAKTGVIMGAIPLVIWAHIIGPDPGKNGVPGEGSCAESGQCHIGTAINGGGGSVAVTFPFGLVYVPGAKQHLTVTITDSQQHVAGFQLTARVAGASGTKTQAGSFHSSDQYTSLLCSDSNLNTITELTYTTAQTCPASRPLAYIEHDEAGSTRLYSGGSESYEFDWTPPSSNVGNITIYVMANAGNGDRQPTGDHIYSATYTLSASSANSPTVSPGGVTGNATGLPLIGPNAYVNIDGVNLSSATDVWDTHISNNTLPMQLSGVSVTIGGKAAYVQYVSGTRVQVLTPPDLGLGSVAVLVSNSSGTSSAVTVTSQQFAPGFFQWLNNQPVTTHADYTDAMKNGTYAGLTTVPAKPGEYVVLWGTGFGPTTPAVPAGTLTPGNATTYYVTDVPAVTLNGQPMTYYATALTSGFAGLYQVIAQVPASMPDGDWLIVATVGGASS